MRGFKDAKKIKSIQMGIGCFDGRAVGGVCRVVSETDGEYF